MQNLKLLDLETGQFLELGKDWLYGGEYINISYKKPITFDRLYCGSIEYKDVYEKYRKQPYSNEQIQKLCELTGAVCYGGRYILHRLHWDS